MDEKDLKLLLDDLCMRLPYGVIYHRNDGAKKKLMLVDIIQCNLNYTDNIVERDCMPYLRPLSSMTEEERKEYTSYCFEQPCLQKDKTPNLGSVPMCIDWLLKNHFDYRGLIEKGLAIKVTEENNPYKNV